MGRRLLSSALGAQMGFGLGFIAHAGKHQTVNLIQKQHWGPSQLGSGFAVRQAIEQRSLSNCAASKRLYPPFTVGSG